MMKRNNSIGLPACLGTLLALLTLFALQPATSLAADGTVKWQYQTGWFADNSSPAVGLDGTVYVGSADSYLYAFNPDGTVKWQYQTPDTDRLDTPAAIGANGAIYLIGGNYLYALKPDGTFKWRYKLGYYGSSCPAIGGDGTIYVGS